MLPQNNRLRTKEIKQIFDKGAKFRGIYGMLVATKDTQESNEFAFVVSKKIGNAPQRNRMTRLLREIARKRDKEVGMKAVYIAFKYCDNYEELEKDFDIQFKKASESI